MEIRKHKELGYIRIASQKIWTWFGPPQVGGLNGLTHRFT